MIVFTQIDSDTVKKAIEYCPACKEVYDKLIENDVKYVAITSKHGHIMGSFEEMMQ